MAWRRAIEQLADTYDTIATGREANDKGCCRARVGSSC
jgi:hypothetical protein